MQLKGENDDVSKKIQIPRNFGPRARYIKKLYEIYENVWNDTIVPLTINLSYLWIYFDSYQTQSCAKMFAVGNLWKNGLLSYVTIAWN